MGAMDAKIYIPADSMTEEELYTDAFYEKSEEKSIIIDGWAHKDKNLLVFVNDCRRNIKEKKPTFEDEKDWNCCFRKAFVNGWPMVVMVTRRDIQKGDEL